MKYALPLTVTPPCLTGNCGTPPDHVLAQQRTFTDLVNVKDCTYPQGACTWYYNALTKAQTAKAGAFLKSNLC